ncbi:MAG: hypothetical protein ACQESR_00950 [Planctomycetota bacterium]
MAVKTKEERDAEQKLYMIIDGAGGPDKYIDKDEEADIFAQAKSLEIWRGQAEAMLNHRCKQHEWTRETEITYYLRVMLEEATKDDGVIDKKEFDHIVGFAVAVRMPRKDAIRICCRLVREGGWKTENEGFLKKSDWLKEYEGG